MSIEIMKYEADMRNKWEYFVSHSDNGTIFQLRKFLEYHDAGRFEDASFFFTRKGKMYAVFPAALIESDGERILYSHPGASYGGFVIGEKIGLEDTHEMVGLLLEYAAEQKCSRIIITQTPSYYFKKYSSYVDFALHSHNFRHRKRELSSVLTLNQPEETIFRYFPENLKRAVRKAQRSGLRVIRSSDVAAYYEILNNNLSMRHNVKPTHTLPELKRLVKLFPDKIRLYAARHEDEMAGGIISFSCNSLVNLAFYIAHNHEMQKYRPVDLLIWELIRESLNQNCTYLDFGTFTLNMEPNWGLCRFKEKFGARGVFRDTFELSLK